MHPYSLQNDQYEHHLDSQDELSVIRSVSGHILWNIQRISPKRQTDINNINGLALPKEQPKHYLEENNSNFTPILHHAKLKLNLDTAWEDKKYKSEEHHLLIQFLKFETQHMLDKSNT